MDEYHVLVSGLKGRPELNGQTAQLVRGGQTVDRYVVRFSSGEELSLKRDALDLTTGQLLVERREIAMPDVSAYGCGVFATSKIPRGALIFADGPPPRSGSATWADLRKELQFSVNHSCAPNAFIVKSDKYECSREGRSYYFALRDIEENEEIVRAYKGKTTSAALDKDNRLALLKEWAKDEDCGGWEMADCTQQCYCVRCQLSPEAAEKDDKTRKESEDLVGGVCQLVYCMSTKDIAGEADDTLPPHIVWQMLEIFHAIPHDNPGKIVLGFCSQPGFYVHLSRVLVHLYATGFFSLAPQPSEKKDGKLNTARALARDCSQALIMAGFVNGEMNSDNGDGELGVFADLWAYSRGLGQMLAD